VSVPARSDSSAEAVAAGWDPGHEDQDRRNDAHDVRQTDRGADPENNCRDGHRNKGAEQGSLLSFPGDPPTAWRVNTARATGQKSNAVCSGGYVKRPSVTTANGVSSCSEVAPSGAM